MTKTLTEQWEKKRIKDGMYYVMADRYELGEYEPTIAECYCCKFNWDIVKEVLAPVPSYSEYKALKDNCDFTHTRLKGTHQKITQLEKKLKIATKALKEYADKDKWEHCSPDWRDAEEALKEMEGVK